MAEEELKDVKKKLDKVQASHKELQNDFADASLELRNVKLDLEKTLRAMEDFQASAANSQKLKLEMDQQYKDLTGVRKDKEKEVQQLMQKKR